VATGCETDGGQVGLLEEQLTKSDIPCTSLGRLPLRHGVTAGRGGVELTPEKACAA